LIEVKFLIPGIHLFAKHQGKTFEEATDLTMETMKRQLRSIKKRKLKVKKQKTGSEGFRFYLFENGVYLPT